MMTPAQLATLKAAIVADGAIAAARDANDHAAIADYYNADHASMIAWRPVMTAAEVYAQIDWGEMVTASVAQRDTLTLFLAQGSIQSALASVRAGFAQIIPVGNTRTALTAAAKRPATRGEALFASNLPGTSASPANLVLQGALAPAEVSQALSS